MDGSLEKVKSDVWMEMWRMERAISGCECGEGKERCVDGSVGWERAMSGLECREGKVRFVHGRIEKGKCSVWMGVWRREGTMSGGECGE